MCYNTISRHCKEILNPATETVMATATAMVRAVAMSLLKMDENVNL